jgi:hypothetical protein
VSFQDAAAASAQTVTGPPRSASCTTWHRLCFSHGVADGAHPERRRKWDGTSKDRLRELERKWRERRIEIIREQHHAERTKTIHSKPNN